jgi:hypothetical protein
MENLRLECDPVDIADPVKVTVERVSDLERILKMPKVIGPLYLRFESVLYAMMNMYCSNYKGGLWELYSLSNGGFYMAPADTTGPLKIHTEGKRVYGQLSADGAGVFITLMALNRFAWLTHEREFSVLFNQLKEYAVQHIDHELILKAIE